MSSPPMLPKPPGLGAQALPSDALAGYVALITGGGSGLGLAIARELGRAGATIVVASRDEARRTRALIELQGLGVRAFAVSLDVRDEASVQAAFGAAEAEFGGVQILINNAAANFFSPAEEISLKGWSAVVDRVLTGAFLCSREFARRHSSEDGVILNVGAPTALAGGPGVAHSAAAKAGVINLTKTLAVEWARAGIRVNCIVPGLFPHQDDDAATAAGRLHFNGEAGARVVAGRVGEAHELGWLAAFLCSPFSRFITGQIIVADGGDSLRRHIVHSEFVPVLEQLRQGKEKP